jgi:phosphoglycolate phosphatase
VSRLALVILDLDGTLYSSRATTLGAVGHAVADLNARHGLGLQPPGERQVLAGVGCTRVEFAKRVFPALPAHYHDEIDKLVWHWERELITAGLGSLFPGALEALEALRRDGFLLAMATNAGRPYMDAILDHFDVRRLFEECRCAGDGAAGDKSDLVRAIVASVGVEAASSVMVGDRRSDIEAAKKAGTPSIGCTWGFGTSDELAEADALVRSFDELPALVRAWE